MTFWQNDAVYVRGSDVSRGELLVLAGASRSFNCSTRHFAHVRIPFRLGLTLGSLGVQNTCYADQFAPGSVGLDITDTEQVELSED